MNSLRQIPTISIIETRCEEKSGVYSDDDFFRLFASATASKQRVMLRSGGNVEQGRYSIAAWDELASIEGKGRQIHIRTGAISYRFEHVSPVDSLDSFARSISWECTSDDAPFQAGLLGYISYDIRHDIERLPQQAVDDLNLPDLWFLVPANALVHDRVTGKVTSREFRLVEIGNDGEYSATIPDWSALRARSAHPAALEGMEMKRERYFQAVESIREYIRNGDVYQVNFAHRFVYRQPPDPLELWRLLYEANPAPYFAYLETSAQTILSTSMEKSMTKRGMRIISQPIKGTRKRGSNPAEDAAMVEELRSDAKEDAELSMIVDLVRNDIGRVAANGGVRVAEHKRLDSYANVHHLSSIVEGILRKDAGLKDLIRAMLPAGSITGCPKIRAMEIIDEREPVVRHIYTGAIGYIGAGGDFDFSVAIRTALCTGGVLYFSVGGGIVYDSIPYREFQETLHKAGSMLSVLKENEWIH